MNQTHNNITDNKTTYITRNKAWALPLFALTLFWSSHVLLVDMIAAGEVNLSGFSKVFPLPDWLLLLVSIGALAMSGVGVMITQTLSAQILRIGVKVLLFPVAIFVVYKVFFS